jgi:hypothetical protein
MSRHAGAYLTLTYPFVVSSRAPSPNLAPIQCPDVHQMVRARCYVATATVRVEGGVAVRRYAGMFKVNMNQTSNSARASRAQRHVTTPVKWLAALNPETFSLEPLGALMTVEHALAEEAILAARGIHDDEGAWRGGPWASPYIRQTSLVEAERVYRIWSRAPTAAAAREKVLEYGQTLDEDSYLRKHLLEASFSRDTAEAHMGLPTGRRDASGHAKRVKKGWSYSDPLHKRHKFGADPAAGRKRNNERFGRRGGQAGKGAKQTIHIVSMCSLSRGLRPARQTVVGRSALQQQRLAPRALGALLARRFTSRSWLLSVRPRSVTAMPSNALERGSGTRKHCLRHVI